MIQWMKYIKLVIQEGEDNDDNDDDDCFTEEICIRTRRTFLYTNVAWTIVLG